ncbi:pyruvate carboxylase [Podila epicladia]|nr:pyruvate carboxylase [Podila epicladia]
MVHHEEHTVDTIRRTTTGKKDEVLKKVLVANRGEIAIRVFRSAHELAMKTVALFSYEDRLSMHRYKADEAYQIGDPSKFTPVGAYLAQDEIIRIAKLHDVSMIHPGYGFLSENAGFAQKCAENGIAFVGPDAHVIESLGDKTKARDIAIAAGVPVVPGTPGPIKSIKEAEAFVKQYGFPVIIKAAMGGGGRGMRVVRSQADFAEGFDRATSEAKQAFGDGTVFIERFLDKPRHIEVQLLADSQGNVVHLFERDCSVQRRHQKVVEIAPAKSLTPSVRDAILNDAIKLAKHVKYKNAEEITGIDIVAAQIQIAAGISLPELGLTQEKIKIRGFAIQCRVTTEDPAQNFQPDTGKIEVYRSAGGNGVRLDGGQGFVGAVITPHYDSLLVKLARRKVVRALVEFRIRGVKTNIPFVQRLITHDTFIQGKCWTTFIDDTPDLFNLVKHLNRAQKLLAYLGDVAVNGPSIAGQIGEPLLKKELIIPSLSSKDDSTQAVDVAIPPTTGWRKVFLEKGAEGFAKAVRAYPGVLIMDTTWRDAHQSLLATRVRTIDLLNIAPTTAHALSNAFALEMWGGATFDVAMRFLHEDPWDRLIQLRKLVPNIPFQMLFRGANAVGYTSYPDNVIYDFCAKAVQSGMDIFRIFDSLNYIENMRLGIRAVKAAGGIVEAAVCYTGDVSDPKRTKHNLAYYLNFVQELVSEGIHILAIKDMAGLLKPAAATILIGAIRKKFPDLPIHVHTHDTAGTGVASMLAAAAAGADVIDLAIDVMSGITSQPSMGAVVSALEHTELGTGIRQEDVTAINSYWEQARLLYSGFEANVRAADSGVYQHEMPGGQYTNLMFQAQQLGLGTQWNEIKKAYIDANLLCGDIVKVTPSSKVVGDLAQFMVSNSLNREDVLEKAASLNFPTSVVEFFQGYLGQPYGGFPEPLRTAIIRSLPRIEGRPGADMGEFDLAGLKLELTKKYGKVIRDVDVSSAAIYPKVFEEYRQKVELYGDLSVLPTRYFLSKLDVGEEISVEIEKGKILIIKLLAVGPINAAGKRDVFFELNGEGRNVSVQDNNAAVEHTAREKADPSKTGDIGAPMSGVVVEIRVKQGTVVNAGDPICILSAMKMETVVSAPVAGKVEYVPIKESDSLSSGDLVARIVHA